jgi:hypothetical protein
VLAESHDSTEDDRSQDPGWNLGWRSPILFVPGVLQYRVRHAAGDGLVLLRDVFVSFVGSLVLFGVILTFVVAGRQYGSPWPWVVAILAIGVISSIVSNVVARPLDCSGDLKLAGSYRTRFYTRMAFAEIPAMFAFVFAFTNGPAWLYYLGAVITLVRMAMAAPTPTAIRRDQDALDARGCERSLVAALRRLPPM